MFRLIFVLITYYSSSVYDVRFTDYKPIEKTDTNSFGFRSRHIYHGSCDMTGMRRHEELYECLTCTLSDTRLSYICFTIISRMVRSNTIKWTGARIDFKQIKYLCCTDITAVYAPKTYNKKRKFSRSENRHD